VWNRLVELEEEEERAGEIWNTRRKVSMEDNERMFKEEEAQLTIFDFIQ